MKFEWFVAHAEWIVARALFPGRKMENNYKKRRLKCTINIPIFHMVDRGKRGQKGPEFGMEVVIQDNMHESEIRSLQRKHFSSND